VTPNVKPPEPGSPDRAIDLMEYWKILVRGRWTILAVFLIVVALVGIYTFTRTPIYKAVATVEVKTDTRRIMPGQDVSGMGASGFGWSAEERYYNTQIEVLKSRDLAQRVAETIGVSADPSLSLGPDPAGVLSKMIQALPRTDTGIIEISLMGPDPQWITDVVNAFATQYKERNIEKAQESVKQLITDMSSQARTLSDKALKAEQQKYGSAGSVPESSSQALASQLKDYTDAHTRAQIRVATLRATLESVDRVKAAGGDLLTIDQEIEGLSVKYLNHHPKMQDAQARRAAIVEKLDDQVQRIIAGFSAELESQDSYEKELSQKIAAVNAQLLDLSRDSSGYDVAKRTAETQSRVYEAVQTKLNEFNVAASLMANNIQILDLATKPTRPVRPRKALNLFLGALFGLLAGVGSVFVLEHLDKTIKSIEDVEQGLQLPVLSIIPRYKETTSHAVKEAFQTLRTNLLFSSDGRKKNIVLLTSAGPKEGKSSTITNLARTIATTGERTLLVDCDLRRPTVHVHLGLERDHGLTNFLMGDDGERIETYVKETRTPNLYALTCGPIPPNPPELFSGDRFKLLLSELRGKFDWVLIDSPPVISLTDSVMLASLTDLVAFVVKHNESEKEMIRRCLMGIRNVNPHVIGAILNNVDLDKGYSKDYYYAGYYYERDGEETGKRKKRKRGEAASAVASGDVR
jgi:succinoglycan biosynthesis transport protein ExoP